MNDYIESLNVMEGAKIITSEEKRQLIEFFIKQAKATLDGIEYRYLRSEGPIGKGPILP